VKSKASPSPAPAAAAVTQRLVSAAGLPAEQLLAQYHNTFDGYDEAAVQQMRSQYGANVISQRRKASIVRRLISAFANPFTVILLVISVVSYVTGDRPAVVIVLCMVTLAGLVRFVQELRSSVAAQKLTEMVKTMVTVARQSPEDGIGPSTTAVLELPMDQLVVGDLVHLAAGDIIPADLRVIETKDLFVGQSSLTGESEPVEKLAAAITDPAAGTLDLTNLAFMGSTVVSGSATGLVLAVGDSTTLGGIAQQLQAKAPPTSFDKGVNAVSWVLVRFMLIMVPVVLIINGFTKGDWVQATLFAVSVAVGLTPEMLPMIVSANLARGAVAMSKKQVVVKQLNSIQSFGAMDVLCTDKTGTLTQDHVVLQYHLDMNGNPDDRVLRHAFLNSHYQTGLKDLMDVSIIECAKQNPAYQQWLGFTKVDEIPFDFGRRRMSVVVSEPSGKTQLITKGAIEEMLSISTYVQYEGGVQPLTDQNRAEITERCRKFNADGLRVLGVSQKTNPAEVGAFSVADETDMVLIGYLAFLDPPKDSAQAAVAALRDYGVRVKVLTGDNDAVTKTVCHQVGLPVTRVVTGAEVEQMDADQLQSAAQQADVFAKLSPEQKSRIVGALRAAGHTVGFMGDGINDAAALKAADVGISVDTAVDIAKESASIILMEKDLTVLQQGVIEGRKTYANIIKYIKMTASSNFGNMLSVLLASALLPFLPMFPIQILLLNLIYDLSCTSIPWDNVDQDFLKAPRQWSATSISKFMFWLGPTSSVFDITTYLMMFFWIGPMVFGGSYHQLSGTEQAGFIALFHAGWFVESLWSQTLVIHMLRTPKIPFVRSRASLPVVLMTSFGIGVGTIIPFTQMGHWLQMVSLPALYFLGLVAMILCYMVLATVFKRIFTHRYGELL